MNQTTIGARITIGFSILILIVMLIGVVAFNRVSRIDQSSRSIVEKSLPALVILDEVQALVKGNFINATQHVLSDDTTRMQAIEAEMEATSTKLTALYSEFEKLLADPAEKKLYGTVKSNRGPYRDARVKVLELSRTNQKTTAQAELQDSLYPVFSSYINSLQAMVEHNRLSSISAGKTAQGDVSITKFALIVGVSLALLCGLGTAFLIIRSSNHALRSISAELADGSRQLTDAATSISSSSQSLAQGASEQAASIEEASAALTEVSSMTKRNAEHAVQGKALANATRTSAETGAADMKMMSSAMDAIKGSSDNIAKIIKTIDQIAFQTNILALNAAVEAARAGEAGMGFAVVAEEVRSLAQRSAAAAHETAESIEDSIQKSANGVTLSRRVATGLDEIVERVRQVDQIIAEIANASSEQNQGIAQVLNTVSQMDKVTQTTAASAEESAAASEELSAQAIFVDSVVDKLQQLASRRAPSKKISDSSHAPDPEKNGTFKSNAPSHSAPVHPRSFSSSQVAGLS